MILQLQGTLTVTMREVRPTMFFSVPRVWEKIQEKMMQMGRQTTGIKKVYMCIFICMYVYIYIYIFIYIYIYM
jgi:long-subunit acyl-CoA synthetase (AMP-forming)